MISGCYHWSPSGITCRRADSCCSSRRSITRAFGEPGPTAKRRRVEELLNDFLAGAVAYAAAEKAAREEREKRHREWEDAQRRRLAEQERRQREESRLKFLVSKMEALELAVRIEAFRRQHEGAAC